MRRSWEDRARDVRAVFIFGVALSARRTREGVRSIAHGPAQPVDGSRPRSRARRTFLNGESGGTRAGVPTYPHAHARVAAPDVTRTILMMCACCVPQDLQVVTPPTPPPTPPVLAASASPARSPQLLFVTRHSVTAGARVRAPEARRGRSCARLCACFRAWGCWRLQWVSIRTCSPDGKGWRACEQANMSSMGGPRWPGARCEQNVHTS